MLKNKELAIGPWIFAIMAALVYLPGLNRGLILDEYKTWMVADLSWPDLLHDRLSSGHFPTYFAFLTLWLKLREFSEWFMRIPGLVVTALGAVPFFFLTRRVGGSRAAVIAGFIYAWHQGVVWIGQTARPYSGVLFFEFMLVWSLVEWWLSGSRRWLLLIGLSTLGGIAFMPLSGLLPLTLLIVLPFTWRKTMSRLLPALGVMAAACAAGFVPALFVAKSQSKLGLRKSEFPDMGKLIEALSSMVYGDFNLWARGAMEYLALLVFLVHLYFCFKRQKQSNVPVVPHKPHQDLTVPWFGMTVAWIFVPLFVLTVAGGVTGESLVSHARYQTPALGGLLLLMAMGLDSMMQSIQHPWLKRVIVTGIAAPLFLTTVAWWRSPGEGMSQVVDKVIELNRGSAPEQLAGHVRWFRYELEGRDVPKRELLLERAAEEQNIEFIEKARATAKDLQVVSYNKDAKDVSAVRDTLRTWAKGKDFWLFVYIQRKDGLDRVAENPPEGYKLATTVRKRYTRAYHLVPISDSN